MKTLHSTEGTLANTKRPEYDTVCRLHDRNFQFERSPKLLLANANDNGIE